MSACYLLLGFLWGFRIIIDIIMWHFCVKQLMSLMYVTPIQRMISHHEVLLSIYQGGHAHLCSLKLVLCNSVIYSSEEHRI